MKAKTESMACWQCGDEVEILGASDMCTACLDKPRTVKVFEQLSKKVVYVAITWREAVQWQNEDDRITELAEV